MCTFFSYLHNKATLYEYYWSGIRLIQWVTVTYSKYLHNWHYILQILFCFLLHPLPSPSSQKGFLDLKSVFICIFMYFLHICKIIPLWMNICPWSGIRHHQTNLFIIYLFHKHVIPTHGDFCTTNISFFIKMFIDH